MLVAVLAFSAGASADATGYRIKDDGGSRISFASDAPLETITGVSSDVGGDLSIDPQDPSKTTGKVRVKTASIKTGVELRDEHLRGDGWLDSERFPFSYFEITKVSGAKQLKANKDTKVTVEGKFTLHGVTKEVKTVANVKWIPFTDDMKGTPGITGDIVRVKSSFTIKLTDYGVSVPSLVRLKVANEIKIDVDLRASAK
ncbi:MAG: YceI family protein [Polyangiales bacterium]